jgi:hypothetical protein
MTALEDLGDEPEHFSDCCVGISKPLVKALLDRLPSEQALILSIGSGSGLLEHLLLQASHQTLNVYGVEVPTCINVHLPPERLLRVPCTHSLHPDALFASALMFVYPRKSELITSYIEAFLDGALEKIIWFGHRTDWPADEKVLLRAFVSVEVIEGSGVSPYELLAVATMPRLTGKSF